MAGVEAAERERSCRSDKRLGERMELVVVVTTVGETIKTKQNKIRNTQKCSLFMNKDAQSYKKKKKVPSIIMSTLQINEKM